MKNTLKFLFILASVILSSCSNNDDNSTTGNGPANTIKKISETTYIEGQTHSFSANFNYENGNLKSISNQTDRIAISYSNGKISTTEIYNNNNLVNSYTFGYENNKLTTISNYVDAIERTLYTYENNILKTEENQSFDNPVWQTQIKDQFVFGNGNVTERIRSIPSIPNSAFKASYDYDTKLNPMNFMANEVRELVGLESCNFKNKNNTTFSYNYNDVDSTDPILNNIYETTYNSQNLPIEIKKYSSNNTLISVATFEYN